MKKLQMYVWNGLQFHTNPLIKKWKKTDLHFSYSRGDMISGTYWSEALFGLKLQIRILELTGLGAIGPLRTLPKWQQTLCRNSNRVKKQWYTSIWICFGTVFPYQYL